MSPVKYCNIFDAISAISAIFCPVDGRIWVQVRKKCRFFKHRIKIRFGEIWIDWTWWKNAKFLAPFPPFSCGKRQISSQQVKKKLYFQVGLEIRFKIFWIDWTWWKMQNFWHHFAHFHKKHQRESMGKKKIIFKVGLEICFKRLWIEWTWWKNVKFLAPFPPFSRGKRLRSCQQVQKIDYF